MKTKEIKINNEVVTIPDIKIGDKLRFLCDDRYDPDFINWAEDYKGDFIVEDLDFEQNMLWIKHCPYGVDMAIVDKIYS